MGLNCAENPRDIATIRDAIKRRPARWRGQTSEMKDAIVEDLDAGRRKARQIMDSTPDDQIALSAIGHITGAARTHAVIEGQNQADDIQAEGKRINRNTTVRILVTDGRGIDRQLGSLREYYATVDAPPPPVALPAADAAGREQAQGR